MTSAIDDVMHKKVDPKIFKVFGRKF